MVYIDCLLGEKNNYIPRKANKKSSFFNFIFKASKKSDFYYWPGLPPHPLSGRAHKTIFFCGFP